MSSTSTTLKYLKPTKFDSYMFSPVNIAKADEEALKVKRYNNLEYVFIPQRKLKTKDELIQGATYEVSIKTWLHNEYFCVRYNLTLIKAPKKKKVECLL